MPDWTYFKDREGNTYFFDNIGHIRTNGIPPKNYMTVSIRGIDFYLNQGLSLLRGRHRVEGLIILKSIQAMPLKNNLIYEAQKKATQCINLIKKSEGTRFNILNEEASVLLYRDKNRFFLINDRMRYSLNIDMTISVLKNRIKKRLHYNYHGVLLGVSGKKNEKVLTEKRGYDFLIAIDSEEFVSSQVSVKKVEKYWRMTLGYDIFVRKKLAESENHLVYEYTSSSNPGYSGFEGIYSNKNFRHIVRIIAPKVEFNNNRLMLEKVIKNFSFESM